MDSRHEQETVSSVVKDQGLPRVRSPWLLAVAVLLLVLVTLLGKFYGQFLGLTNIGMLYLLPVVFTSAFLGLTSSIVISVISVVLFDVLFVPPVFRLAVNDARYLISFAVFMVVAWTTGSMSDSLRLRMREALNRETRTKALYDLAKGLSALADIDSLAAKVVIYLAQTVNADIIMYLPDKNHQLQIVAVSNDINTLVTDSHEAQAADWSFCHSQRCGYGEGNFPAAGLYLPITTEDKTLGVLGIKAANALTAEQLDIIEASAGLAALGVLRLRLAEEAQNIKTLEERERLSAALFNSVSHDMKTPLASILGAISGLVDDEDLYDDAQKTSLLASIKKGALRMNRVINNLLDMARLESGYLHLSRDWCDIQDIIGVTLRENGEIMQDHSIKVEIPGTTSLIEADYALIEQVLTNLLYNAAKYSPTGSEIVIRVEENPGSLVVSVSDQGNGIKPGDEEQIFEKFYRLRSPDNVSGSGLGLSICRGIIEAHGGRIWAENRPGQGTVMTFTLPVEHRDS